MGGYSGTAGNSLGPQNGDKWSTWDQDNDDYGEINCARTRGPSWHGKCSKACPLNTSNDYFW